MTLHRYRHSGESVSFLRFEQLFEFPNSTQTVFPTSFVLRSAALSLLGAWLQTGTVAERSIVVESAEDED